MSDTESAIVIFHNPDCGNSRRALQFIESSGHSPRIVEYLKTGWTRPQLEELLGRLGESSPRAILREKEPLAAELGLLEEGVSDDAIFDAMVRHPVLVNRPIVVTPKGAVLARPTELLREFV